MKFKAILIALLAVLCFMLLHDPVSAQASGPPIPNNFLPRSDNFDQGNGVYLIAAIRGGGYVLDAPNSTVRLYSPSNTATINIVNGGHCIGSGPDRGPDNSNGETIFRIWALRPDNTTPDFINTPFYSRSGPAGYIISSKTIGCAPSYPIPVTNFFSPVAYGPAEGKYAFEIEAIMQPGPPGWNMFKYNVAAGGGRFSYYAGSGDKFGLKDDSPGLPPAGERGNFKLGFAAGCSIPKDVDRTVTIKWFDADAGEPNQIDNPVRTRLIEYSTSGALTNRDIPISVGAADGNAPGNSRLNIVSGDDESGEAQVTIKGYRKYAWVWENIHSANGIQFQLPFDSYNTLLNFDIDCQPPSQPKSAACTVDLEPNPTYAPSANVPVNQSVNITVRVRNTGDVPWDSNYKLQQRTVPPATPGQQTKPVTTPPNVGKDQVETFVFTVVRNSPVSITFDYKMLDEDNNTIGNDPLSSCRAIVTWGSPPPGGFITATCSELTYTGDHFTPNGAGNYINGAPNPKSRFVGSDNATEYGAGNYVKVAVTHQVIIEPGWNAQQIAAAHLTDNDPGYALWVKVPRAAGSTVSLLPRQADGTIPNLFGPGPGGERPQYRYTFTLSFYETNQDDENDLLAAPVLSFTMAQPCWQPISCGGLTVTDYEPGQTLDSSYRLGFSLTDTGDPVITDINVDRDLINVDGDPRGNTKGTYSVNVSFEPGISGSHISPNPIGVIDGEASSSTIQPILRMRVDYTGKVFVRLMFGNNQTNAELRPPCEATITPRTRPYLKITQGDISTGGAFRRGEACDADPFGSAFQAPNINDPSTYREGGIRTFANPNALRGSSVDFAAFALGVIDGSVGGPNGFYSSDLAKIGYKSLSFANTISEPLGGLLGGNSPNAAAHCATDFFNVTQKTNGPFLGGGNVNINAGSGQRFYNGPVTLNGNVNPNTRTTIYVRGDVYIRNDINYVGNWNIDAATNNTPYFALIVEGNINVDPGVNFIEGFYVAQPNTSGVGGTFSTCSPGGTPAVAAQIPGCRSPFTLNGALLAQKVLPLRSNGTLWNLSGTAEVFNFTPSMIIGIPEFKQLPNTLEGLFRLPPVF